ncbi:chorismate mutase 1 chloroplastic [Phtheirospermum japonicum]|uniref:chorismate mutase n=1 Tax=Phtheirospermum japonicum TaxID=374723 RepID=A0A830BUX7_9LAMI|nr:chorismate mutase 1 chloroplastic [Phtheirospermum japonicum]
MEAKLLRAAPSSILSPYGSKISRPGCTTRHQTGDKNCSVRFQFSRFPKDGILAVHASAATIGVAPKNRVDETQSYTLDGIRNSLIRQEDSIIFSLVERSQFCYNEETYDPNVFAMDGFQGSLVEYMVKETEKLHGKVLHPSADSININFRVWDMYFKNLLPRLVKEGDDAEAKFRASPEVYKPAIKAQDRARLMDLLTYPEVEEKIKDRVEMKTRTYGQELNVSGSEENTDPVYKINPILVADLYGDWIMPLTKQVQVEYLLRRLD